MEVHTGGGTTALLMFSAGLRNGLHGAGSIDNTRAPPSHQTNPINHPGCTHGVLRPPRPGWTQKSRHQSSQTKSNGMCVLIGVSAQVTAVPDVTVKLVVTHAAAVVCIGRVYRLGRLPLLIHDPVCVSCGHFRKNWQHAFQNSMLLYSRRKWRRASPS